MQAVLADLDAAQETINRLQSEAHDTSMEIEDMHNVTPADQAPLRNKSRAPGRLAATN